MNISKLIIDKQEEERKKQNQAEAARLNVIVNELYAWFDTKGLTVKDARIILSGMVDSLEKSMSAKTRPIIELESKKTIKEFYIVPEEAKL